MKNQKFSQIDIYEDFEFYTLFNQIFALKKWIVISTLIFLTFGVTYCLMAKKTWVSQVKIGQMKMGNQQILFFLSQQTSISKYGLEPIGSESILNEFAEFIDHKSDSIKIRKDIHKTFLIQAYSDSPNQADQDILNFLNEQNSLFLKDYRDRLLQIIETRLTDEWLLLSLQQQTQAQRQQYVMDFYQTWLDYLKLNLKFGNELRLTAQSLTSSKDSLYIFRDKFVSDKFAIFNSKLFIEQETKSMKEALLQIKFLLSKPMQGHVFQITEHVKALDSPRDPNIPIILILSAILGFTIGLFGILLYLSSSPVIRQK